MSETVLYAALTACPVVIPYAYVAAGTWSILLSICACLFTGEFMVFTRDFRFSGEFMVFAADFLETAKRFLSSSMIATESLEKHSISLCAYYRASAHSPKLCLKIEFASLRARNYVLEQNLFENFSNLQRE